MNLVNATQILVVLYDGEKRATGRMLIDNILSALKDDATMSSRNSDFLCKLYHDAMNRYEADIKNFSFWTEARDIATWINSLS